MGNCLPYFPFLSGNGDDLTRLENLRDASGRSGSASASTSSDSFESTSSRQLSRFTISDNNGDRNRQRYRRNLQPSSYVNELYVNSALGIGDEESMEEKALDDKRKARVRGLLEQINVDYYTKGGKGDDECAICMVDFVENEAIRYLPCMHSYHLKCIDDWLLRSFTCPSCMEPVDSAILSAFTVNSANANLSALPCSAASLAVTKQNRQ